MDAVADRLAPPPGDSACVVCGTTFEQKLDSASGVGEWTFHWDSATGVRVIAETCSPVCTGEFDNRRMR